jgi:hypothetical protein
LLNVREAGHPSSWSGEWSGEHHIVLLHHAETFPVSTLQELPQPSGHLLTPVTVKTLVQAEQPHHRLRTCPVTNFLGGDRRTVNSNFREFLSDPAPCCRRHTIKTVNKITILVRFWCSEVSLHIQEFSRILEFVLQAGGRGMLKKMAKMRAALKNWGPHGTD